MGKGIQIAIAALTVFLGLGWFLSAQSEGEGSFLYYKSVADYLAQAQADGEDGQRAARVHGFVVDGTIQKVMAEGYVDFVIRDEQNVPLSVRYAGIDIPDLFKDGAEVVVEGRFSDGLFVADRLMAKCPSKYEAAPESGTEA